MRVVVTGATGNVGTSVLAALGREPRVDEIVGIARRVPEAEPLLTDADPLGVSDLTTHEWPLEKAPEAYDIFQKKLDGCIKVVLRP